MIHCLTKVLSFARTTILGQKLHTHHNKEGIIIIKWFSIEFQKKSGNYFGFGFGFTMV